MRRVGWPHDRLLGPPSWMSTLMIELSWDAIDRKEVKEEWNHMILRGKRVIGIPPDWTDLPPPLDISRRNQLLLIFTHAIQALQYEKCSTDLIVLWKFYDVLAWIGSYYFWVNKLRRLRILCASLAVDKQEDNSGAERGITGTNRRIVPFMYMKEWSCFREKYRNINIQ